MPRTLRMTAERLRRRTFPRFLELPSELQIQILELAIENDASQLRRINIHFIERIIGAPPDPRNGILNPGTGRSLRIPIFYNIMASCSLARQVTLQWWLRWSERHLAAFVVQYPSWVQGARFIEAIVRDLRDLCRVYQG